MLMVNMVAMRKVKTFCMIFDLRLSRLLADGSTFKRLFCLRAV